MIKVVILLYILYGIYIVYRTCYKDGFAEEQYRQMKWDGFSDLYASALTIGITMFYIPIAPILFLIGFITAGIRKHF